MIQKVLKVGSSVAVTIPKKSLKELGLKAGDSVYVEVNRADRVVSFRPVKAASRSEKITELTLNFINRYRGDLEALARE